MKNVPEEVSGDFSDIYARSFHRVFRAAYLAGGDAGVAEDAAQEAFVRLLERWSRLAGEPYVEGWLMTTAINVVKRHRARSILRRRREFGLTQADGATADASLRLDVRDALGRLSRRQQQVTVLYYYGGIPVREIASLLRCGEGTVKQHLSRAREALRTSLGEAT